MPKRIRNFQEASISTKYRLKRALQKSTSVSDSSEVESIEATDEDSSSSSKSCHSQSMDENIAETSICAPNNLQFDTEMLENSENTEIDSDMDDFFDCSSSVVSNDDVSESATSEEWSDNEDQMLHDDNVLNEAQKPLYSGAPITVLESCIAILTVALRFKMSGALLSAILNLISLHCATPNFCYTTLYKFKKFFNDIHTPLKRHFYCSVCTLTLDTDKECFQCKSQEVSYFLEIPVLHQVKQIFKRSGFCELLRYPQTRIKKNDRNYEDIYDGDVYKNLINDGFFKEPGNFSMMWNTDGISLFNSSKFNVWPLYLSINELPYTERFKKENVILAGLWFGYSKPIPNMFISQFRQDLAFLYKGIDVNFYGLNSLQKIRGQIICGTCDLPAKSLFLNLKQFNGDYGCSLCKIRTQRIENVQTYPFKETLNLRTTTETEAFAKIAYTTRKPYFGVKGPSAMRLIVSDYICTTAVDVMHCVYEGVVKNLIKFWFEASFRNNPYSLIHYINLVNSRILSLKPPVYITRIPRSITDVFYFKASEFKIFLYVYSLPILNDIMRREYFEHHIYFVLALSLLNNSSVSNENIVEATILLKEYVMRFEYLYGPKYRTSNLHLLLHLPDVVKKFGPLWSTSCSPFENLNGILKGFVHGSKYAQLQICSAVSNFISVTNLTEQYFNHNSQIYKFCKAINQSGTHRRKLTLIKNNSFAIGKIEKVKKLSKKIKHLFKMNIKEHNCLQFRKLLQNNKYYESDIYINKKKTNSSYCIYEIDNEQKIGIIKNFLRICDCEYICNKCDVYAIVSVCTKEPAFFCQLINKYIPTIYMCSQNNITEAIPIDSIKVSCFHVIVNNTNFVVEPTNSNEPE